MFGVAYIIFTVLAFFWLKKYETSHDMYLLTLKAPLIFIPIQAFTWIAYYYEKLSNPALDGGWEVLLPFAAYILIVGYVYVFIVHMVYLLFDSLGWLVEVSMHSNQ